MELLICRLGVQGDRPALWGPQRLSARYSLLFGIGVGRLSVEQYLGNFEYSDRYTFIPIFPLVHLSFYQIQQRWRCDHEAKLFTRFTIRRHLQR